MASFDSPLGKKSFAGQQLREFDIPDESGIIPDEYSNSPVRRGRPPVDVPPDLNSIREFQNRMQMEQQPQYQQHYQSQEDPSEIEQQMRQARELKRSGKERLNEGAKRRIDMLLGMTQATRAAVIDNNEWVLQTLKSKEMREALTAAAEFDGTIQSPFEIRRQLLARSLVQIAGVETSQFLGSVTVEARLNFIDEQVEALLNRLYSEYLILVKESNDKYAIKTAEDAQEVVEDLKK